MGTGMTCLTNDANRCIRLILMLIDVLQQMSSNNFLHDVQNNYLTNIGTIIADYDT